MLKAVKHFKRFIGIALWLGLTASAFIVIYNHAYTPASVNTTAPTWPAHSRLHEGAQATLVMFIHPYCPCSHASLIELNTLLGSLPEKTVPLVHIVFFKPGKDINGWKRTNSWKLARKVRNAHITIDSSDNEVTAFKATVSGQIFAYDNRKNLVYTGGITGSRGHEGLNSAEKLLSEILKGSFSPAKKMPVFGCPLLNAHRKTFIETGLRMGNTHVNTR